LKPVHKEYFDKIFPELEKVYNHSGHIIKLWEQTVSKKLVNENWEEEVKSYWRQNK
jgi:N-acetylneuraminic acid mutarotase